MPTAAPAAGKTTAEAPPSPLKDVVTPAVPGFISSIVLEQVKGLNGLTKISVAAAVAFVLWWLVKDRGGAGRSRQVTGALRRRWRWALLGLADLAVLALAATVALLDRPTLVTAIGALAALALLLALAYQGRRSLGALAAAVSGAMIGLCLGIAVLG